MDSTCDLRSPHLPTVDGLTCSRCGVALIGGAEEIRRLRGEIERLRAELLIARPIVAAAKRWHDTGPRIDPNGAEEAEGALVLAVEALPEYK